MASRGGKEENFAWWKGGELHPLSSEYSFISDSTAKTFGNIFTADVRLHLHLYDDESYIDLFDKNEVYLYLHSDVIRRSQYFSALLSGRWQTREENEKDKSDSSSTSMALNLSYKVPASMKSIDTHQKVIKLLYSTDVNFSKTIDTVSSALSILPVAIELLFEDCVKACIRLIEALPWTEEEEQRVLDLIPLLKEEESQELLSRVSPVKIDSSNEMEIVLRLIQELRFNYHQKNFVDKMLWDFASRDSVRLALNQVFEMTLKLLKEALEPACSSERRQTIWEELMYSTGRHTILEEKSVEGYLSWLVESMIGLRVADTTTLHKWIDQEGSLTENLQKVCSDKTISPRLLVDVFRCTWMLADAVSTGHIVADRQVRMQLVKFWLPVVLRFKDVALQFPPVYLCYDFEEPFFKIISTLPMLESQELLLQCLGFSTDNLNDCSYFISAFKTWFRRTATQPSKGN